MNFYLGMFVQDLFPVLPIVTEQEQEELIPQHHDYTISCLILTSKQINSKTGINLSVSSPHYFLFDTNIQTD